MRHLLAFAVLSAASCVAEYDETPVEDCVVFGKPSHMGQQSCPHPEEPTPEPPGGWHKDNGPMPESCASIYKQLPNGMVLEIPVECQPIVIPWDDDDWENPSEPYLPEEQFISESSQ